MTDQLAAMRLTRQKPLVPGKSSELMATTRDGISCASPRRAWNPEPGSA